MGEEIKGGATSGENDVLSHRPKRLQDELDAADERLRQAAQNFSVEWKSFLAYAMKIKQDTTDFASFPDKNRLEDLLLHSQSGLLMMREMEKRRDDKWRHLLPWYREVTIPSKSEKGANSSTTDCTDNAGALHSLARSAAAAQMESRHRAFRARFHKFVRRKIHVCYTHLTRKRGRSGLPTDEDEALLVRPVTKLLQHSIDLLNKLDGEGDRRGSCALSNIGRDDIESYLRYLYERHRFALVSDRFITRAQWLLKSHRYHIRQRMLDICYQQQARNIILQPDALLERAKVSPSTSSAAQCPHFPVTHAQLENELVSLLFILGVESRGHPTAIKLRVDEDFSRCIAATKLGPSQEAEAARYASATTAKSIHVVSSRWDLMQLTGGLPARSEKECGDTSSDSSVTSPSMRGEVDALLRNEWDLLRLDDDAYLRARLEGLAKSHWERAILNMRRNDIADQVGSADPLQVGTRESLGLMDTLLSDQLETFYKSRFLVCRRRRQQLLRAVNYLQYVAGVRRAQAANVARHRSANRTVISSSPGDSSADEWAVDSTGETLLVSHRGEEMILQSAWAAFEALEIQIIRAASFFVVKQQNLHWAGRNGISRSHALLAVDRMQTLCDIYECEVQFYRAKIDLVQQLSLVGFDAAHGEGLQGINDYLESVLQSRPLVDWSHSYMKESYASATAHLELQRLLMKEIVACKTECRREDPSIVCDDAETLVYAEMIATSFAKRFVQVEQALFREAEELWFVSSSVSEYHALTLAMREGILAVWKIVAVSEVCARETPALEGSRDNMLHGLGWGTLCTPLLSTSAGWTLGGAIRASDAQECEQEQACYVEVVDLLVWRYRLGREVYETRVLEEIHNFQINFVTLLHSRRLDDGALFVCERIEGQDKTTHGALTGVSFLVPVAELIAGNSDGRNRVERNCRRKRTVRDWLEAALRERLDPMYRASYDEMARIQSRYKYCLVDVVNFQDLVACEVVEFAATAPRFFMTASAARQSDGANLAADTLAMMSLPAVKWKYMDEIVERAREVSERTCTPHFVSLQALRSQLLKSCEYGAPDEPSTDGDDDHVVQLIDPSTYDRYSSDWEKRTVIPRLIVELDCCIRPFRNEKKLMEELFPSDHRTRCAFAPRPSMHGTGGKPASSTASMLSEWLNQKIEQLNQDFQTKQEVMSSGELGCKVHGDGGSKLRRKLSVCRQSFLDTTAGTVPVLTSPICEVEPAQRAGINDDPKLFLDLPSSEQLIDWFADPSMREAEHESDETNESNEVTLRTLIDIYQKFAQALKMLRLETSLGFHLYSRQDTNLPLRRPASVLESSPNHTIPAILGQELLKTCQTALHRSINEFHERLVEQFRPQKLVKDIFQGLHRGEIRKRHQLMVFRCELSDGIESLTEEWRHRVRCGALGAAIESFSIQMPAAEVIPQAVSSALESVRFAVCHVMASVSPPEAETGHPTKCELALLRLDSVTSSQPLQTFWRSVQTSQGANHLRALSIWLEVIYAHIYGHVVKASSSPARLDDAAGALKIYAQLDATYNIFHRGPDEELNAEELVLSSAGGPDRQHRESRGRSTSLVSGTGLKMRTPEGLSLPPRVSEASVVDGALRIVRGMSSRLAGSSDVARNLSQDPAPLPTKARLLLHAEILRVHFNVQWIDDDIKEMQRRYESFLSQKSKFYVHQQRQRQQSVASASPHHPVIEHDTVPSSHKVLLEFSPFYRPRSQVIPSSSDGGEFVIPAHEMAALVDALTMRMSRYYEELLASETNMAADFETQSTSLRKQVERLSEELGSLRRDEAQKRESFAVDRSYELQLRLEKQHQDMRLERDRVAFEQQMLRSELVIACEKRLTDMHMQLLAKQQQFEQYRQGMHQDMKQQLRAAQSHLVNQLVDQSGAMSIETKTSLLESLQGQAALEHAQKENLALKQTLLKLQTLYDMQSQTRDIESEKEQVLQETNRMRESQLVNENLHLQHQLRQLEAEMTKISQERAVYQIKVSNLQKHQEALAQKRREAKIRALSAPYRRRLDGTGTPSEEDVGTDDPRQVERKLDYEDQAEKFEQTNELRIRSARIIKPSRARTDEEDGSKRDEAYLQNTTRHFQNEIKRLHIQLGRETKVKAQLLDQVAQLRNEASRNNECEGTGEHDSCPRECSPGKGRPPRLVVASASPRVRATSASVCSPRQNGCLVIAPKRPSTSFSPRARSPASASHRPARPASPNVARQAETDTVMLSSAASGTTAPLRSAPVSASSHRKFDVQPREPAVVKLGGIAGVQNALSARERLPYR